jgi:hypothetical protein
VAASLALLVGFAITITWGGVSAAQSATEAEAVAARQIGWSIVLNTGETYANLPEAEAQQALRDLVTLLEVTSQPNAQALVSTTTEHDPVDLALRAFQRSVRQLTYNAKVQPVQSGSIQSAADAVAAAEADTNAIAQRRLPALFIFLILITAVLLAALQGICLVSKPRPWAALAWAGVVALSITVVLQMDSPFTGDISVNRESLADVAAWISSYGQ